MHQKGIQKDCFSDFTTPINLETHIKLPEIPLDISVCDYGDGSDNEDPEVKQGPMDSKQVIKLEESPPELKSEDPSTGSNPNVLVDAHLPRVTASGKPY